jgi:hypothetical protein
MRFLAILALCLMAVFALVHSLPDAPAAAPPDARAALRQDLAALHQTLARLRGEQQQVQSALGQARAQQMTAESALAQLTTELRTSEYRLRRSNERVRQLERELATGTQALSELRQRRLAEARELQRVEQRLAQTRRRLEATAPVVADVPVSPAPAPTPAPAVPIPPAAPVQPPAEGFSLRFESERALRALVRAGRVDFFARGDGAFLRLDLSQERDRYTAAAAPAAYFEMAPDTVPPSLKQALVRHTGRAVTPATLWGVTLPQGMQTRIRTLTETLPAGALVIGADGRIGIDQEANP